MWLFLATEVLFFGGLFVLYCILRYNHPEIFSYASNYLDTVMGGVNTCVLILSSLTMALAVRFAQINKPKWMVICLVLTLLGAVGFLVIKYFEYTHKIHDHLVWGSTFYVPTSVEEAEKLGGGENPVVTTEPAAVAADFVDPSDSEQELIPDSLMQKPATSVSQIKPAQMAPGGIASMAEGEPVVEPPYSSGANHLEDADMPPNTHLFFGIYYCMTGLHGVHVLIGMALIVWLIVRGLRGHFSHKYYTPVDLGGLYWHIVDLIWIFLFPMFYLIH